MPKILVVEDKPEMLRMFRNVLETKLGAQVVTAMDLEEAQTALRSAQESGSEFDALVTDCGFPRDASENSEHPDHNGIRLVEEVRKGLYGGYHAVVAIAFNSAEHYREKGIEAKRHGGPTEAFRKGSNYPGFKVGNGQTNFTVESVTAETVKWLRGQLTERKIAARKSAVSASEAQPATQERKRFSRLFSAETGRGV